MQTPVIEHRSYMRMVGQGEVTHPEPTQANFVPAGHSGVISVTYRLVYRLSSNVFSR